MKIWNKQTGQPREVDDAEAQRLLRDEPDTYADKDPNAGKTGQTDQGKANPTR